MTSEPELNARIDIICDLYNPTNAEFALNETYPMLIFFGAVLIITPIILAVTLTVIRYICKNNIKEI